MAYVNPMAARLAAMQQAAVMPQRSGRLVAYNPIAARQQVQVAQAEAAKSPSDQYVEKLWGASAGGAPAQPDSGGFWGTILNNPIGKGAVTALGAIDLPRRVITAGLVDALAPALGLDRQDKRSFGDRISDPSYGIGKEIGNLSGNQWLDRLVGFTGDVALDPMTYVTLGAGKFAGGAGRIAAATKLADAGLDASKVGRLGVLGANAAEREAIFAGLKGAEDLAQPGLRFAGARIPGTGKLAEGAGRALAGTRAAVTDMLPEALKNLRRPDGLEAAYKTLASGKGATNDALAAIARTREAAASSGRFGATFANEADRLAHTAGKVGNGEQIFAALDEGLPLDQVPGAQDVRTFLDNVAGAAQKDVPTLHTRQDYAPRIYTQEGRNALRGDEFAQIRKEIGMDVTQATGGAVERKIGPGTRLHLPDGNVVEFVADTAHGGVSARQINDKLAPLLGVDKVVETDIARVLQPYVEGIADSVGRAKGLRRLGQLADTAPLVEQVDKQATAAKARSQAASIGKELNNESRMATKATKDLNKTGQDALTALVNAGEKKVKNLEGVAAKAAVKKGATPSKALADLTAQLDQITKESLPALAESRASVSAARDSQLKALSPELDKLSAEERAIFAERQAQLDSADEFRKAYPRDGTKRERKALVAEAKQAAEDAASKARADVAARRAPILEQMSKIEQDAVKEFDRIDASARLVEKRRVRLEAAKADNEAYAKMASADVRKAKAELAKIRRIKTTPGRPGAEAYRKVFNELDAAEKTIGTFRASSDVADLMTSYAQGVAKLKDSAELQQGLRAMQKAANKGDIVPVMRQMVRDGYEQIGKSLLGDEAPIVRQELARQLQNLDVAVQDAKFWKVVDKYTQFFKTYATATVGFHARNGMSAAFMNATDGVSIRNMEHGIFLWERYTKNPQAFFDNLPEWITPEQADQALQAVFGSGGGSGQFGKAELRLGHSKLLNNPITRTSQKIGGRVEGYARMGMAIDSILGGQGWEEAAARITRIHFDYSQVSKFDKAAKRLIPFWTFTSRNLPLQLQQMFLKPRIYQAYQSFARNMGQNYQDSMIPLSWQESGAFQITKGVWAAPDLPHIRLKDELAKLTTDPQRLLADANPLLKVPFETLIADRKLYSGQPFDKNGFESVSGSGLGMLGPVLSALGLTDTAGDGTTVMNEKLAYALRGLIPPVAQVQRLAGNDPYYADKRGQSVAANVGIPLKFLTPGQQAAEQKRREKAAAKKGQPDPKLAALAAWTNGG